ncbi:MAG: extracellular solute-binding protein [Eubacteriales bacterium]
MKKRILAAMMCSAMVVGSFAGCSSSTDTATTEATTEAATETATEATTEASTEEVSFSGTCVIVGHGATHNTAFGEAMEVLQAMDKYADVTFDIVPYEEHGETYEETMPIQVMGGEQIDIVYNGNPIMQASFADGGITIPMTEYVEKYGLDLEETYGAYADFAYTNGEVYGLPGVTSSWGLFYNKDLFDAAGVEYPDSTVPMTWTEYAELCAQLTSGTGGDKIYGSLHINWPMYWYGEANMAIGGGENFYKEDGSSNLDDPAFLTALTRTLEMQTVDKSIPTEADAISMELPPQAFFNGNYAMHPAGTYFVAMIADEETNPHDFEIGLAPMPVDEGTEHKNWGIAGTYSMTQTTADKDLAFNVIVDLIRETTKLTSSEAYADQTVAQDNLFVSVADDLTTMHPDLTTEQLSYVFNDPDQIFVNEKITGESAADYQTIMQEEVILCLAGEQDPETALANAKERIDEMLGK